MPSVGPKRVELLQVGADSETTGVDFYHGTKPFFWTNCDEEGNQSFWEWDVDPETRQPTIPEEDLDEIEEELRDKIVIFQNGKFDVKALATVRSRLAKNWNWKNTRDTLYAGHLLCSNQRHDITTMAQVYLGINIKGFEDEIQEATNHARRIARSKYPTWRLAKEGLSDMPSLSEKCWQADMWLPREIARAEGYSKGECKIVNLRQEKCDLRIDRSGEWGNPFMIGRDGDRATVISKYRKYLYSNKELMEKLPELDGKRLGCFCKPDDCHGDILQEAVREKVRHPWWDVLKNYANPDSGVLIPLHNRMMELFKERDLVEIYREKLKLLPIAYGMEDRGVTVNRRKRDELRVQYVAESAKAEKICVNIAKSYGHELVLPKGGNNKALINFVFGEDGLNLDPVEKSEKTGVPSLNKYAIEKYQATLPERSKSLLFINKLREKRQRDTAIQYMDGYERFWVPLGIYNDKGEQLWYLLHPNLNVTGTHTLRWSSQSPNEQNISKKEGFNLRYLFGPAPGREWWSCDAKNIELRLPAYGAREEAMIDLFERPNEPPYYGSNHLLVAHILHKERFENCLCCVKCTKEIRVPESNSDSEKHCKCSSPSGIIDGRIFKKRYESTLYSWTKNGNFAVQYGALRLDPDDSGYCGTADRAYHVPGAQTLIQERLGNINELNRSMIRHAKKWGYVETMPDKTVNPRRGYPLYCTRNKWGKILETVPLSYHIQGTAMQWMAKAMVRVDDYLKDQDAFMVMQVHDELVFDFPAGKGSEPWKTNRPKVRKIQKLMEESGQDIGVPTPVSCEWHSEDWSKGLSV